jgi:hypothetical protein
VLVGAIKTIPTRLRAQTHVNAIITPCRGVGWLSYFLIKAWTEGEALTIGSGTIGIRSNSPLLFFLPINRIPNNGRPSM